MVSMIIRGGVREAVGGRCAGLREASAKQVITDNILVEQVKVEDVESAFGRR